MNKIFTIRGEKIEFAISSETVYLCGDYAGATIVKHSSTPKLYHSIKEIGEMFDEEQHILRYWEREFDCLNPSKNRAGNRVYTDKDIRVLKVIKKLLRSDRLPVVAAKELLKNGISEAQLREADELVRLASVEPTTELQESGSDGTNVTNGSPSEEFVNIRKSDLRQVIGLLQEVADQIESL